MTAYCASKAGTEAFADSLRAEVAHHGVAVGCAYFSWIDTEMVRGSDRISAFEKMRSTLNYPFSKTYPVEVAADAVVKGIESRAKRVCGPGWIKALQPFRGVLEPTIRREGTKTMPEIERLYDAEVAERGTAAVSAPVGAGGAALK
jgi:NAD(P)-dependent dehydrogenase (short-subunit alcohol dehydrogenase family)